MKLRTNPTISNAVFWLRRYHWLAATILILTFFGLSFGEMIGDSATIDELAHIPASYTYVHFGDYRLNPEHPPLLKDLAGIPLQFLGLRFDQNAPAWSQHINDQYGVGFNFMYYSGNNAEKLIFWARLPLLLFASVFAALMYVYVRRRFGTAVGLVALLFFAFSPNFIAHSHYVTTDVGASIGIFAALLSLIYYFERRSSRAILVLSLGLAFAQVCKFSSILLFPFMLLVWSGVFALGMSKRPWKLLGGIIVASLISLIWVYLLYIPNTIHLTAQTQIDLYTKSLYDGVGPEMARLLTPFSSNTILRPLLQYVLGLGMVLIRVNTGNVTYFNGMIATHSFHGYFPEIFLLKTQVAFLILLLGLPIIAVLRSIRSRAGLRIYLKRHRFEVVMGLFVLYYFGFAVAGNLNLGIRHLLPVYPPLFVLVAIGCVRLVRTAGGARYYVASGLGVLLAWYGLSTALAYPNYLSYFNGLLGGPTKAGAYFSDSGLDWGQDLYRLRDYVEAHPEIHKMALDYFGGGYPQYTFCDHIINTHGEHDYDCTDSKIELWHADNGPYAGQYIAISETYLMNELYLSGDHTVDNYADIRRSTPVAQIGNSIYVYKLY